MPPETEDTPPSTTTPPAGSEAPAPEGGGTPPASEPPPAPQGNQSRSSVNHHLSNKSMADMKASERERGRKAALAEMDRKAKKLGYKSNQDMLEKLEAQRAGGRSNKPNQPAKSDTPAPTPTNDRQLNRAQREIQRSADAARRANKARAQEEKRRRELEKQLAATEARQELQLAAVRAGVKDVDYAIHLLEKQMSGKSEQELAGFDEEAFFSTTLRQSHPYLYGVEERPAGPAGETRQEPKAPPKPAEKAPAKNGGSDKDVRKMSSEEYNAELKRRGLTPPGLGMPG